jgi:hypothetical protein
MLSKLIEEQQEVITKLRLRRLEENVGYAERAREDDEIIKTSMELAYEEGRRDAQERHLTNLIIIAERISKGEVTIDEYLVRWKMMLRTLTPPITSDEGNKLDAVL